MEQGGREEGLEMLEEEEGGRCIRKQVVDLSSFNVPLHSSRSQLLWGLPGRG